MPVPPALVGHPDELAVRQLAGYGLVPDNILATLPYAWRVYRRRKELRQLYSRQQETHGDLCRGLRQQLADVIDEATAGAANQSAVQSLLAPIAQAEQLIGQRSQTLDAATDQYSTQLGAIDHELSALRETRKQVSRDRDMAQIQVEDAVQKRAQAQAALRRMDERIQVAHDAASDAAGRGADFAPPEHARKIASLQSERAPLVEQLAACEAATTQAHSVLRQQDKALRDEDRKTAATDARRKGAKREAGQAQDVGLRGIQEAQDLRLDACQSVVTALQTDHPELLTEDHGRRIGDINAGITRAAADLERHRLAIDAYDGSSFKRGLLIVGAIGVVILLLIVTMARVSGPARTGPESPGLGSLDLRSPGDLVGTASHHAGASGRRA